MLRLMSFVLLLAALALGTVACGELSKEDYKKETQKIADKAEEGMEPLNEVTGVPTKDDLNDAADVLDEAADELDGLTPPADVKDAHDKLVKGIRGMADVVREMGDAIEDVDEDDPTGFLGVLTEVQEDLESATNDISEAVAELSEAGFDAFDELGGGGGSDDAMAEDAMSDEEMEDAMEEAEAAMEELDSDEMEQLVEDAQDAANG